jgi:hypothetical protein
MLSRFAMVRFARVTGLVVPLLAAAGCANLNRAQTYGLEPGGSALVRQACSEVMGIGPAFAEFDACADSLAQSVRTRSEADLISRTNAHCQREGFEPGTVDLAKCVVLSKETLAQSEPVSLAPITSDGPASRSYWSVSVSQQNQRMELSCAHLGLHPASPAFGQCVANLKNALLFLQNPL